MVSKWREYFATEVQNVQNIIMQSARTLILTIISSETASFFTSNEEWKNKLWKMLFLDLIEKLTGDMI